MKLTKYRLLVSQALSEDAVASRDALKALNENRYNPSEHLARAVFEVLPNYKDYMDSTDRFDALVRLVNLVIWSKSAAKHKEQIIACLIDGLQHASGKVRENARKAFDNLPVLLDIRRDVRTTEQDVEAALVELLEKIETLIAAHQPKTVPNYIDKLSPSVYKTLVMTWHDTILKYHLWEKLDRFERMMRLDIPPYSWEFNSEDDEDEPEEEDYSMHDWQDCVEDYFDCADWVRARALLVKREAESVELLEWALAKEGCSDQGKEVIRVARQVESHELPRLLMGMTLQKVGLFDTNPHAKLAAMNKVARAIQSIDNNTILRTVNGNSFSRMLTTVALQEIWRTHPRKVALLPLLESFNDTHQAVDEVVEQLCKPAYAEFRNELARFELPQPELPDYQEPRQVAHYIIDWLLQIEYRHFVRKSPRQLAAIAWAIFNEINLESMLQGLDNNRLCAFADWSSVSSLTGARQRILVDLQEEMADPTILLCA